MPRLGLLCVELGAHLRGDLVLVEPDHTRVVLGEADRVSARGERREVAGLDRLQVPLRDARLGRDLCDRQLARFASGAQLFAGSDRFRLTCEILFHSRSSPGAGSITRTRGDNLKKAAASSFVKYRDGAVLAGSPTKIFSCHFLLRAV